MGSELEDLVEMRNRLVHLKADLNEEVERLNTTMQRVLAKAHAVVEYAGAMETKARKFSARAANPSKNKQ